MIQSAAPMPASGPSQAAGKVHGASANTAGAGSFLAILGNAGASDAAAGEAAPTLENAMAAIMLPVAGGNTGKATGKILPDLSGKAAAKTGSDADADSSPSEATEDPTGASLALAGTLPLPFLPLPGADVVTAKTHRAAEPASKTNDAAPSLASKLQSLTQAEQALVARALPEAQTGKAPAPAAAPAVEGAKAQLAEATNTTPALQNVTVSKLAPIEVVADDGSALLASDQGKAAKAPATIAAQLATRAPQAQVKLTQVTSVEAQPQTAQPLKAMQIHATDNNALKDKATGRADSAVASNAKSAAKPDTGSTAATSQPASATANTAPLPLVGQHLQTQTTPTAEASINFAKPLQAAEGPQDFSTLVSRLNEAREAANPQFVRTAISHAEFGKISLQFKHEGNGLSVTMANSDPNFTGAVHAAAQASQAAQNQGQGDNPAQSQQQQQQNNNQGSSAQQHSAANGAGAGMGQGSGQNQQARADQAGQSMNRGQASAAFPHDQDASAARPSRDTARGGSGIYA